jgi:hypothetical protein
LRDGSRRYPWPRARSALSRPMAQPPAGKGIFSIRCP